MNKNERIWMTVAPDLSKDFRGFCNGASYADGLRALLAIAAKYNEAPFGINENKED